MSVTFWLMRVSPDLISINHINEENILEIGTSPEIISVIYELYPDVRFDDGCYYFPGCTIENPSDSSVWKVCLGDEPVKLIYLSAHVGKCDLRIIQDLCHQLKCCIFDPQHGKFIY
ncbi:hypothetical protein [Nostoc sp. CHAB 5715]|uniref:hypothetical protein n=1 Tax=Nostoc sp. CHAB 5715 TaxID=2780400 RepID=UPI001E3632D0|nr:hypothetical protein [Nostoc sp. CHAB 5715]MCC5621523.1 hypothetical protein [Nostoc sp. CHAB 5715]